MISSAMPLIIALISGNEVEGQEQQQQQQDEKKLCHPLCTCEKCSRRSVSRKQSDPSGVTVNSRDDQGQTGQRDAVWSGENPVLFLRVSETDRKERKPGQVLRCRRAPCGWGYKRGGGGLTSLRGVVTSIGWVGGTSEGRVKSHFDDKG